jgi:signal transduction histidine kinase
LHDDVTQRLAVLAIDAGRAELAAHGGAHAEVMRTMRERLVRLSEDIHALAYQLHPSVLEELGLGEALKAECERQGRRSGLARADRAWLARLISRCEPPAEFKHALARQPDDIKVVIQFAAA